MKERLIGDDQLLVTADTTLGDPLWDWVAADAARRAEIERVRSMTPLERVALALDLGRRLRSLEAKPADA